MNQRIYVVRAAMAFILVALLPTRSLADTPGIISLFGLSFDCAECEVRTDPCRVAFEGLGQIVSCEEATTRLLGEVVAKGREPAHPTPAELRQYLLNSTQSPAPAASAIKLLLRSESGRRALTQDAFTFATKYEAVLASAVSDESDQAEVWLTYWRLPSREGITLTTDLRARIFAAVSSLGETELYDEMTIIQPESDLKSLETFEGALKDKRPEVAASVAKTRAFLSSCRDSVLGGGADQACDETALGALSADAQKFVERVRIQWLIHAIDDKKLGLSEFVDRLSRIDFAKVRTPAVHETLVKALDAAKSGPAEMRAAITAEDTWKLFRLFSENDRLIANRWATVLSQRASELFDAGKIDEAHKLFEESFRAVGEPVEARAEIMKKMAESAKWQENPELQERFRSVIRNVIPEAPWWQMSQKKLVGIFAILCGLSFVWIMVAYAHKMKRAEALEEELKAIALQEELAELSEFFEVSEEDGEAALTKSYRKKAKETHPDLHQTTIEDFKELQTKYQRARELMFGIKYGTDETDEQESGEDGDELSDEPEDEAEETR